MEFLSHKEKIVNILFEILNKQKQIFTSASMSFTWGFR
jgi:hypothetical protein